MPEAIGSWPALGEMAENVKKDGDKSANLQPNLPKEKAGFVDMGETVDQGEQGDQPRGANKKRGNSCGAFF